jgi:putative hydrolase of HD superfamily
MWINEIFLQHPDIVRIGLTTWSGNTRMMSLSDKLGLVKEAVFRKARIINNEYYDSVSYGILREEWEALHQK